MLLTRGRSAGGGRGRGRGALVKPVVELFLFLCIPEALTVPTGPLSVAVYEAE